jgi:ribosomal 50S subunit-associated protein YjgA (DUF615 family)
MNMDDMTDVDFNDMAELDRPVMSEMNVDDLMADVAEVQTILQCNDIGQKIDVNEIYEKLEELTYIRREQRIEYVATQLLHKLGVIVEQDVAPEDRVFRFAIQKSQDGLIENSHLPNERVAVSEVSESRGTRTENCPLYSNDITVATCENYITEPPPDTCHNCVSVPQPGVIFSDTPHNNERETEHSDLEIRSDFCGAFDPDAETLINDAKLIYSILPHHDYEQIYACLEANRDCDIRVDVVTDMFLQLDAERGVAQLPCTEVTLTSSVDTSHAVSDTTNPASVHSPSISPLITPTVDNIAMCHKQTGSHNGKPHSVKHSRSGSPSFPYKISADAGHKAECFSGSEHRDKEGCQGTHRNGDCEEIHIFHNVDVNIENAHRIVTGKIEIEAQHDEGNVREEDEATTSSFGKKIRERSVEAVGGTLEQIVSKENAGVMSLFKKQKISKDDDAVMALSAEQKGSRENVEMTPLSLDNSVEVTLSSSAQPQIHEESFELVTSPSCKNTVELAASENGAEVFGQIVSDDDNEDTLSYNSCKDIDTNSPHLKLKRHTPDTGHDSVYSVECEIDESHPSCSVPEIVQSQNLSETSSLSSASQDFAILHHTDLELNDLSDEIGDNLTDFEFILRESHIDATGRFENGCNCDEPTSITNEAEDHDHDLVVDAEGGSNTSFEQSSASFESANTYDDLSFQDSLDEAQESNRIVAKLRELFPDASINFLTEISRQFDSLTDMVNKVLELDDGGDRLVESASSVSVVVPEPPAQGCRKKEITYEEFVAALPHADPMFLMKKWKVIGNDYNAVKEFIAEQIEETSNNCLYHMLLSFFPHADPNFLHEKCNIIGNNEAALRDFIEEQSRSKTDTQYHTLLAIFPQADSTYLRKKCIEIGNDEGAMREFITEQLKENEGDDRYHNLVAMFPDADPAFIREAVRTIGNDEDGMRLFVAQQLDEVDSVKFETLLAVLPDADPEYLRATFDRIGNDEEGIKVFLLESLENKDYPTREAFLKRQEMATLRRKYKEEFNIEDFIEIIPDPWKHFYEENNSSSSELIRNHGMAYLETRFRMIPLNDIRASFQKNNHNLTLTCDELDSWTGPMRPPSNTFSCTLPPTEDIPVAFLQEVRAVCSALLQQRRWFLCTVGQALSITVCIVRLTPYWYCTGDRTFSKAYVMDRVFFVRFEVFMAATMKNGVFWDVTPWGSC